MNICITNDIEQECSNLISMYTDTKYIKARILQSYPELSESKQGSVPKKIKSHIDQANNFLLETDENVLTAPLTLFYAIHNYAKALFLVNYPNLSLSNAHGLDFNNDVAEKATELGEIECTITKKGAFTNLLSVTKDEVDKAAVFRLKDVFSVIPELREVYYSRYLEEPNLFLAKEVIRRNITEYEPIFQGNITDELRSRDFSLLSDNSFHLDIAGNKAYMCADANCTDKLKDNVTYFDVYGNTYFTNSIKISDKRVKLSKIASLYVSYYSFSMLVRYYPEKWTNFCQTADIAIIRKLLVNCRREMLVEVLQLLSGKKYTYATKIEKQVSGFDSSELLKELLKEARSTEKRTGKNPFLL